MDKRQVHYEVARSEYPGHAVDLARQAVKDGHGCVVAVGGDGTALEVAQELVNTGTPMGLLPCGTGNDLSRALKIPKDIPAAVELLLSRQPLPMDAATANDKLYFNVAGFGFDVDVLINTDRYKNKHSGMTAYLLGLFRALFGLQLRKVKVISKEKTMEASALLIAVCNGSHFGGGMHVAPLADPSDGMLDVCLIHDVSFFTILMILSKFVKGKHLHTKYVTYWKTRELTVLSDPGSPLQLDGEIHGNTPVVFRCLKGVLMVKTGWNRG